MAAESRAIFLGFGIILFVAGGVALPFHDAHAVASVPQVETGDIPVLIGSDRSRFAEAT